MVYALCLRARRAPLRSRTTNAAAPGRDTGVRRGDRCSGGRAGVNRA